MPETNETDEKTAHPADSVVMNASPVCRLFVVLSWYADEADRHDPVELAGYLAEVARRFDREENAGCGHEGDGDCDCEECEGYGEVAWTYARPAEDFFMWDALGSWPHRDEFLEELYRLEGEALFPGA